MANHNVNESTKKIPIRVRYAQISYFILASIFIICIIIQVFIAGMAIFENPVNWGRHTAFVHIFEYVPMVMVILSFLGRLPWRITWGSLGLFILIVVQYATAHGLAPAFHTVIALVLFLWSYVLVWRSFQIVTGK